MKDALTTIDCTLPMAELTERFASALQAAGLTIFARIDHAENARSVGLQLRPTVVFIFGNPLRGTAPMQDTPTMGLDLPFRVLVWEDDGGSTHLTYERAQSLAERHGLDQAMTATLEAISAGVVKIAASVCPASQA
jgi:uncharacterized protein (DUF302 family)